MVMPITKSWSQAHSMASLWVPLLIFFAMMIMTILDSKEQPVRKMEDGLILEQNVIVSKGIF